MARKNNKDIKSSQSTQYSGNVTITIKDGNKTVKKIRAHNQGTYNLFYGMLIAMSGTPKEDYLPNYISLGTGIVSQTESQEDTPLLMTGLKEELNTLKNNRRPLTKNFKGPEISTTDGKANGVQVAYQGSIPYEFISSSSSIKEIGLFGTVSGDTLLARIQLANNLALVAGQSLVITWTFSLVNA